MEGTMTIGKRILALRKQKGFTQEQLANLVNVSPQAVSKWENDVSSPDISIVPDVASVLGVTTDELLGVKGIEPHVVVVDTGSEKKKQGSGSFHWDFDVGGGVVFALTIILVGVAFLLSKLEVFPFANVNFWGLVWPAAILGIGVAWCVRDFSPFALGTAVLGLYFLLFNLDAITFELTWGTVWPILLILVGLSILWDRFVSKRNRKWKHYHHGDKTPVSEFTETEGYIKYECSFCEDNRVLVSECFAGAKVDASFGKSTVDLSACKRAADNAVFNLDVSFGTLEIIVPRNIRALVQDMDKSFGSITVKGEPAFDAVESFRVSGDVSFGSFVIRYV